MMAQHFQLDDSMQIVDLKGGQFFPYYNLKCISVLGEGHDGTVVLASSTGGLVAVKTFQRSQSSPGRTRRFLAEVNAMRSLSHPNLVQCYQAAMCDDYFAFSMPYYPGGDLTTVLSGHHQMDTATILRRMIEVSFAVEYLHERCFAHLDIKLENVFLDGAGHAHLGDLGLLKHVTTESRTLLARDLGVRCLRARRDVLAVGVQSKTGVNVDYKARMRAATGLRMSLRSALDQMLEPDPAQRPTASKVLELFFMASVV
ncbi:protein kinase-like protein [Elysia marginata]|uniref:non-specific serine/threonine protein kinase n=1 Tax=Elysia marginata TaxID=1093978 RepID=A0AAV4F460_9GAST|nr:protein kinase-like protein [Elysia marginata]